MAAAAAQRQFYIPEIEEPQAPAHRRFSVHGADDAPSRAYLVEGANFEDAALHFVEHQHPQGDGNEVAVLVEDCETGERQYFRVDLGLGDA